MPFSHKHLVLLAAISSCFAQDMEKMPSNVSTEKPALKKVNFIHALFAEYLRQSTVFKTTVDFTIPLFSFKFPTKEKPGDHTALIRQNLVGQIIYFAVVLFSFVASIALPAKLDKKKPAESRRDWEWTVEKPSMGTHHY